MGYRQLVAGVEEEGQVFPPVLVVVVEAEAEGERQLRVRGEAVVPRIEAVEVELVRSVPGLAVEEDFAEEVVAREQEVQE